VELYVEQRIKKIIYNKDLYVVFIINNNDSFV
jgi:hypothetical protein